MDTAKAYVQMRDGNVYVGASRVTLESIVKLWRMKRTPEEILADFPTLSLAAVYGSIAYYLDHQQEMDAFFQETEEADRARQSAEEAANPAFFAGRRQRLAEARSRRGHTNSSGNQTTPAAHPPEQEHLESPAS